MNSSLRLILLVMLVFTCSSRLLTEGENPTADNLPKDETTGDTNPVVNETPPEGTSEEPKTEPVGGEGTPAAVEHKEGDTAGHHDDKPDHSKKEEPPQGFHKGDKPAEPRTKRFWVLMAVSILMIGAVCSAFIMGKKNE